MKVLFICKGNYNRSQIAEAVYGELTHSNDASSAGTYAGMPDEPEGQVLSDLMPSDWFETLESHGLKLRDKRTKRLTPEMLKEADVAVSMAEAPYIPEFLRADPRVIWWDVADNQSAEATYQQIKALMEGLTEIV